MKAESGDDWWRNGPRSAEGIVYSFDSPSGLGVIVSPSSGDFSFQCTQIADGTREIEVGAKVRFRIVAGGPGAWEAAEVVGID